MSLSGIKVWVQRVVTRRVKIDRKIVSKFNQLFVLWPMPGGPNTDAGTLVGWVSSCVRWLGQIAIGDRGLNT